MADRTVKCICVLHNTVLDREGVDETSLLELQNQEDSFRMNLNVRSHELITDQI